MPTPPRIPDEHQRLEAWHDGSAICLIASGAHGDPLDLGEHEVEALIARLQACLREERGGRAASMASSTSTSTSTAVRPAAAADAHALAALSLQVWLSTYATEGVSDLLARYVFDTFTPASFTALAEDPRAALRVAEVDGQLVGYALVRFGAEQALEPACDTELCRLYVQEPFTGAGIGAALLEAARTAARERTGRDALWLAVNARNRRASRFYEKQGFVVKGRTWFALGEARHENHVLGPR